MFSTIQLVSYGELIAAQLNNAAVADEWIYELLAFFQGIYQPSSCRIDAN